MIVPGIPRILDNALDRFVSDALVTQRAFPGKEAVGAIVMVPDTWEAETGWVSLARYVELRNKATGLGEFIIDTEELLSCAQSLIRARKEIAARVCELNGWTSDTPWSTVVYTQEVSKQQAEYVALREETAGWDAAAVRRDPRFEQFICSDGSLAFHLDERRVEEAVDEAEHELKAGWSAGRRDVVASLLSAPDYLLLTGHCVLGGIAHSHPSGVDELSPQDFLSTRVVEVWQNALQYRLEEFGQSPDSTLESVIQTGSWLYALPLNDSLGRRGKGTLVRFDKRGIIAQWKGSFGE